ncbi:DMT family transporter [Kaistia dalseonensis]|uniref:Drug/metabolite transporter (DMT)-like permease n=1 Tax=Kaistia dalseonensis TaxID=410840 RepID=A0ABU0HBA2_9HYPH|nr:DMT family transporter [Kaistia dalseonensis]MCX5496969.1 DMT family transporter [Kaistia dalseonensis]MDQ0439595.1 drug/metabolite transporter (DMT)-like permease [Kaistia dalseonensis]
MNGNTIAAGSDLGRYRFGGLLQIALFCVIWSSAFAAAKIALPDCPPLLLLAIRFLAAGSLMFALAALTGRLSWPDRRTVGQLALLGAFNNAIYLGFSFSGMQTVSSAFAAVIISANPLLTGLAAATLLGEHLSARKIAGLVLGMAGVFFVVRSRLSGGHEDLHGTILVILGLIALVSGTVLFKKLKPATDLWTGTAIQALAGGILLMPVALATESVADIRLTPAFFGGIAYLIVAVSIGAYWLWFRLLQTRTATEASALHFLMPPLGLLFGWLVFREPVSLADLAGIVPIAIGIAMVTRG